MPFSLNNFLSYYLPMLGTWEGMLAIVAFLLLGFMVIVFDRSKWVLVTLLLWMGTFGVSEKGMHRGLLSFFEQIRPLSRVFDTALLALMLIPTIMSSRGRRSRIISPAALSFFCFGLVMSMRHFYDNSPDRAILGFVAFGMIFVVISLGASRWIQTPEDEFAPLNSIVAAAALLSLATIVQLAVHYSGALTGRQLAGTTENPNSFGSDIALALPIACYLMLSTTVRKPWRIFNGIFVAVGALFLLWSGSRASVIGAFVSILVLFRTRLRFWFAAILVGGVMFAIVTWLLGIDITGMEHLTSTGNTRYEVWSKMVELFIANPAFGVGSGGLYESSYLGVAAGFGIAGLLPFVTALGLMIRELFRAGRTIMATDQDKLKSNMLWGWTAGAMVMSVFEAHLAGTYTFFIYSWYLMMTVTMSIGDRQMQEHGFEPIMDEHAGMEYDPSFPDPTGQYSGQYF